jgi:LuxR family transcriptional regulator/LuxR family quorum-sensing system transcriptional regulator CciR
MKVIKPHPQYGQIASEFLDKINNAGCFDTIMHTCWEFIKANNGSMACYYHLPPLGAKDYAPQYCVAQYGFPEKWAKKYLTENLGSVDPIPKHIISIAEPVRWTKLAEMLELTEEERYFATVANENVESDGFAIPVFGPNGRNGYFGIGFSGYEIQISTLLIARFQSMAQIAHQRYCTLLNTVADEEITLSDREKEILEWIIKGKSNSVISDIIGLSSHTVDTYLRRIYKKLDVSNRVTAALRAISVGVI